MKDLKVKKELIGASTTVQGIGQIKIREDHVSILAQAGRWDLLDGDMPNVKKLVPVVDEVKEISKEKKRSKKNATTE